ncbi:hypothetical protein PENCOP_c005G08554 [Penicillium coprophilum]|uniref:Porphobilinogen deaminase n=1 Tax=Penicillium coprophilum TaxID=36646 RepID=A0A1V6USP0_9EURO|nr:hypothetical protein PENCOP_c005G08554 [Penicillium coprophilum]
MPLRIGTRRSNLAVFQAEGIRDRQKKIAPDQSYEIETLRTLGDRDQSTALYNFDAKNLWTTELEEILVSGELDVIKSLKELPEGAIVGTSSVRRSAQLRRLYPHLRFANICGNVETRLAKVDKPDSEYTCMLMSVAGLERVGLKYRISQYLQSKDGAFIMPLGKVPWAWRFSTLACLAERSLMRTLEGGCSVPIGVETEWIQPDDLKMTAIVVSLDGSASVEDSREARVQTIDEATALGKEMAARLVKAGAEAILKDINMNRPSKG